MIIFDFETTDLTLPEEARLSKQPEIIEFAGVKIDESDPDLAISEELEFLCRPKKRIPEFISNLTNITNEMVENEFPFVGSLESLESFFRGERICIAHNVAFDIQILSIELRRLDRIMNFPWPSSHLCTAENSAQIYGKRIKLGDLYEKTFGKKFKEAHRAMPDVKALASIVRNQIQKGELSI